jgi:hypothetical protein
MEKKHMKLVVVLMCIVVFWGCGSQRRKDTTDRDMSEIILNLYISLFAEDHLKREIFSNERGAAENDESKEVAREG